MSPTEVKRQAKGLRLIDPQPDHRPLSTLDLTAAQAGAHRRQSCHAVYLERSHGKPRLVPVCTQPDRHHTTTPSPDPDPTPPGTASPGQPPAGTGPPPHAPHNA